MKPVLMTLGDPCGIGPEIVAKTWVREAACAHQCCVVGDAGVMARAVLLSAETRHLKVRALTALEQWCPAEPDELQVWQIGAPVPQWPYGQVHAGAGRLAGEAVLAATRAALKGLARGIVTAPLHKEALHAAGAPYDQYPGHTELLQDEAARHAGVPRAQMPVRMMLANPELRTVLVTIHMSLRKALDAITYAAVLETLRITHEALLPILGRPPRMAVAGVNPHAGEGGLFGDEEQTVLAPAIAQTQAQGMLASGPYAPDTVFMRARNTTDHQGEFDVVLAMYHDQGLIPVKYLGVEQGVNVTLGLPLIRTSPDHGTAFDIAGRGLADPSSLQQALRMALQLADAREARA
ncbi:MAG: 4-hydroxythreonine-4-phosphate dehydrogenase 2 [Pseudomonadota bacterium]|jgi:4-hydroxythreonine-4-phosphate dehydrogenase